MVYGIYKTIVTIVIGVTYNQKIYHIYIYNLWFITMVTPVTGAFVNQLIW